MRRAIQLLGHFVAAFSLLIGLYVGVAWASRSLPKRAWLPIEMKVQLSPWYLVAGPSERSLFIWLTDARRPSDGSLIGYHHHQEWKLPALGLEVGVARWVNQTTMLLKIGLVYFPLMGILIALALWRRPLRRWMTGEKQREQPGFAVGSVDSTISPATKP